MSRWLGLAAGPLLVLVVGIWLIYGLDDEDASSKKDSPSGIMLPSGLNAELQEVLWDQPGSGLVYRFRFVAPEFRDADNLDQVMVDLEHLCTGYALPRLPVTGPRPKQVIISLADRASKFGEYNAQVVQVFEAYAIREDACVWEMH